MFKCKATSARQPTWQVRLPRYAVVSDKAREAANLSVGKQDFSLQFVNSSLINSCINLRP